MHTTGLATEEKVLGLDKGFSIAPVPKDDKSVVCLATFLLGGIELGLELECLREAIEVPKDIIKVPLVTEFCEGIFNLRGEIVPLVDLARVLHHPHGAEAESQKVVILVSHGRTLGIRVDSTGSIISYPTHQICRVANAQDTLVVSGIIQDERRLGGILQVLCPDQIMQLPGMPTINPEATRNNADGAGARQRSPRRRFIRFELEGKSFGLRVSDVIEVFPRGEVRPAQVTLAPYFLGLVMCRKNLIPLLDTAQLLGNTASPSGKREHIIVVQHQLAPFALLVDEIREFLDVDDRDRYEVPVLSIGSDRPVFDQLLVTAAGPTLSIAIDSLVAQNSMKSFIDSMRNLNLYGSGTRPVDGAQLTANDGDRVDMKSLSPVLRAPLLIFSSRRAFGAPVAEVREIVPYPTPLIEIPGSPPHILGILSLRGLMAPVLDLSMLLWNERFCAESGRILVVESSNGIGAVLVNSVDEIVRLQQRKFSEIPPRIAGVGNKLPAKAVLSAISLSIRDENLPVSIISLSELVAGIASLGLSTPLQAGL